MTSAYLQQRADLIVKLDTVSRERQPEVTARTVELLDDPEQRDPDAVRLVLDYLAERHEEENDSEEGALEFRATLAEYMARDWKAINSVKAPARGATYQTARAAVLWLCESQAFTEIVAREALDFGGNMGDNNAQAAARMSENEKKKIAVTGGVAETPGQVAAEEEKKAEPDADEPRSAD